MFKLQQQAAASQRKMSPLRGGLKRPEFYLGILALLVVLLVQDLMRQPSDQTSARIYLRAVGLYQIYGRPISGRLIRCRYRPTCSEYSAEAVRQFGLSQGLRVTLRRLMSCRESVVDKTYDPVHAETHQSLDPGRKRMESVASVSKWLPVSSHQSGRASR